MLSLSGEVKSAFTRCLLLKTETGFSTVMQVVGAAASGVASFAVDSHGCVWSWGASKRGQLGQGPAVTQSARPARLPGLEGIASIACGWGHALALRGDSVLTSASFFCQVFRQNIHLDVIAKLALAHACAWNQSARLAQGMGGLKGV